MVSLKEFRREKRILAEKAETRRRFFLLFIAIASVQTFVTANLSTQIEQERAEKKR